MNLLYILRSANKATTSEPILSVVIEIPSGGIEYPEEKGRSTLLTENVNI